MKNKKISKLDQSFEEDYLLYVTNEDEREVLNIFDSLQENKQDMLEYGSGLDSSYN